MSEAGKAQRGWELSLSHGVWTRDVRVLSLCQVHLSRLSWLGFSFLVKERTGFEELNTIQMPGSVSGPRVFRWHFRNEWFVVLFNY